MEGKSAKVYMKSIGVAVIVASVLIGLGLWSLQPQSKGGGARLGSGKMFDSIAPWYDTANKFMSLNMDQSWRRVLVDELGLPHHPRTESLHILDIATGTGDVAIMVAKDVMRLGLESVTTIVALDPSTKMLDHARIKIGQGGFPINLIKVETGNAEEVDHLRLAAEAYDKITISFGIRNFADRGKALRSMVSVLKDPDASQVVISEFVTPRNGPLAPLARFFLVYAVPLLGKLVAGPSHSAEYDHLRDSILNFPSPEEFLSLMHKSGMKNCHSRNVFFETVYQFSCRGFDISSRQT